MRLLTSFLAVCTLTAPLSVNAETFRDWTTTCGDSGCRTYTSTEVRLYEDTEEPNLVLLEIDERGDVVVSGLISFRKFREFYTTNPPTELRRDGRRYVADMQFFNTNFPATLRVDGEEIMELSPADDAHLVAEPTSQLIYAFQEGLETTVSGKGFCASPGCDSQTLTFSLLGFTKAYAARTSDAVAGQSDGNVPDPISVVASALPGNQFGIQRSNLRMMENPRGEGAFVYVPKVEIAGYDRYFVWFVRGGRAIAINGPTITATPDLPRPVALGYDVWQGTGLSESNVTDRALAIVYGR